MATRSATQRVAASLEPGSRARWATSAKQMRSTTAASRRRPSAACRRALPMPRRAKSASSTKAPQCLAVDLVGASEVVDDLGHGGAGLGVALVVGELQVADHGAVLVAPPCLPEVHTYKIARRTCSC